MTDGLRAWAVLLEYDGAPFVGWQRQAQGVSVQQVLEGAAEKLNGGAPVACVAAGRTDAGVHASGQVASLRLPDRHDAAAVVGGLNFHMRPWPVVAVRAAPVADDFSARFSATGRAYRYMILNRLARPALDLHVWHVPHPLDADAMARGAEALLGRHDFTSFRAAACQAASPVRTLDRLEVTREGDRIVVAAEARSFLHHQVRNMVGTLRLVGDGRWTPDQVAAALAARDRRAAGPTAPAAGLRLTEVRYPAELWGLSRRTSS
jgi:tRNA pseudouridine38-40 synthase